MIDLKKPRLTENNKYTGEADCATPCCDIHKDCALGKNAEKGGCFYELVSRLNELENAIESGELVLLVHGRWENRINEYFRTCSNCEISMGMLDGESLERFCYCPFCGAKMDLEEEKCD